MKMVHIRFILLSIVVCIMLSFDVNAAVSSEDGFGSSSSGYRGPYRVSDPHEVNKYYQDSAKTEELQQILYQEFLAWGMTPQGSAAVVGNIICESGGDPTRTQSNVDWNNFSWGNTGLGLVQWTYWSLQADLFNTAHRLGKQWTDLSVQIEAMKHIFGPGNGVEYLYRNGEGNAYNLAGRFMDDVERPAIRNYALRGKTAADVFNRLSGLDPESYDGSYDNSGSTGEEETVNGMKVRKITDEWELAGMPKASGISKELTSVRLPGAMTDYKESSSLHQIGEDISVRNEFKAWETARVVIVFVGMLLVMYGVFLFLAYVMDNVNSFIDISFVSLMSFGALYYTRDTDYLSNPRKFISGKRLLVVDCVIFVIGLLCISGGVFSYTLRALYWVYEMFR